MKTENSITKAKNVLVVASAKANATDELRYLMVNFCGTVVHALTEIKGDLSQYRIYACGEIANIDRHGQVLYIIQELSNWIENLDHGDQRVVSLGQVPVILHNAGVFFRRLFEEDDYFDQIKAAHQFQDLTESNKPGMALRKGIYLTEVSKEQSAEGQEMLHFRLLRCSSNLSGPTDNFRDVDHMVVKAMREAASLVFEQETSLNHVLAQIYENRRKTEPESKESKAKIKAHSDKTKDMPADGLIAFCTFYDPSSFQHLQPSKTDRYDWCYKHASGLTSLHFKLKKTVKDDQFVKEFSVPLYPNSVFFIPLSTNRLYTHEIRPSVLDVEKIPTRLGYVVRCSNAEAVYMNDQVYIKENGTIIPLEAMTDDGNSNLKTTYKEENLTENKVQYGKVHFSMNTGDYLKPIY